MATCATCNHDNPDGAWSCASCGQPLSSAASGGGSGYDYSEPVRDHDYYQAPTIYGTSAPTIPPLASSRKSGDGSNVLKVALIGGLIAVVVIVAVWFFFLKGASGAAFVGTWQATGGDPTTVRIEQPGGDMHIFITVPNGQQTMGPFKGEIKRGKLQTRLEYAGDDDAQRIAADMYKGIMGAVVDNFALVFSVSGDKLTMKIEGNPKKGIPDSGGWDKPVEFTKVK